MTAPAAAPTTIGEGATGAEKTVDQIRAEIAAKGMKFKGELQTVIRESLPPGGRYAKEKEAATRQFTEFMNAFIDDYLAASMRHPVGYEELDRTKKFPDLRGIDLKSKDAIVATLTELSKDPSLGDDARALLREYVGIFDTIEKYLPKGS